MTLKVKSRKRERKVQMLIKGSNKEQREVDLFTLDTTNLHLKAKINNLAQ